MLQCLSQQTTVDGQLFTIHLLDLSQSLQQHLQSDPASALAYAYDIVLNGTELGGGSIRIHDRTIQKDVFSVIGLSDEEANSKFGFLLEAFQLWTTSTWRNCTWFRSSLRTANWVRLNS